MAKTKREETIEKIINLTEPLLINEGFELVELEMLGAGNATVLRFFIDKPGGVTLDDCANVSEAIDAMLDVEDPIETQYELEVSSPGLDRPLRKATDYVKFAGKHVRVKTFGPIPDAGDRKVFDGKLEGLDGEHVKVVVDGKPYAVPLSAISKAQLVWEQDAEAFKPKGKKK